MRFVVVGAGAVGGVIGGRLFEHGHDVLLVARGQNGAVIASNGLVLESPDGAVRLMVPTVAQPSDVTFGGDDVVILAVKSQDTLGALNALERCAPASLPIVCAQNGVENERSALRRFRDVYGMCVICPATHLVAGHVQANSAPVSGLLDLGRWPRGSDDLADSIAQSLGESTFRSQSRDDIARWKWAKLLLNLGNAVEAVCGHEEPASELAALAYTEGVACLRAAGIDHATAEEDTERRAGLLTVRPIEGHTRGGGSTWQSLKRGAGEIETDYLTGEIVMLGRIHGVPTPVNELLQALVNAMAAERREPGSLLASDVLRMLD